MFTTSLNLGLARISPRKDRKENERKNKGPLVIILITKK